MTGGSSLRSLQSDYTDLCLTLSFRIYFGIFFLYLSSLQQILKRVQDDSRWTVGWRTFGPTLRTDVFHIQQTLHHTCPHAPETLDCRRMTSITWSGGEATTQNSPIFFPWEIKMKIQIHLNLPATFLSKKNPFFGYNFLTVW